MPTKTERKASARRKKLGLAWCSGCRMDKPQTEFESSPSRRPFGLSSLCLLCNRHRKSGLHKKKYWLMTDEERRQFNRIQRLKKFGLTLEQYDQMLIDQNGVCAICKQVEKDIHHHTGEIQSLAVDHDHDTGKVRGLLCGNCNKGIGSLRHNIEYLRAAIQYLED